MTVLYEDDDLLFLDKPRGMLVEATGGGEEDLLGWVRERSGRRVRPVHRLDRDTTGVVLFAKNARWNKELTALFEEKRIRKEYWAIVVGSWDARTSKIETRIDREAGGRWGNVEAGGKRALTTFRILGKDQCYSWMQALPKTGRTHQIRLHCLKAGHPIVGDRFYSDDASGPLLLHARSLTLPHPDGSGSLGVEAPPPEDWKEWLKRFEEGLPGSYLEA